MTVRPPQEVLVEKRKHPATVRTSYRAAVLGRDRWGEWLLVGDKRSLLLLPDDEWWVAWFRRDGTLRIDIVSEVGSGAEGQRWFIDVDLDIERGDDGALRLLDEDQFAERSARYPADWASRARQAVREVMSRITRLDGPFDGAHRPWAETAGWTPALSA